MSDYNWNEDVDWALVTSALQRSVETQVSNVNTSMPATVVSYNPATNRAVVRPSLPKRMANGSEVPFQSIVEVPVLQPTSGMGGKQGKITMPIGPGDGVMLSFQERSIEGWLSGRNTAPDDPRQYDLSDAVAVPGLNASGVEGNATDIVIAMDKSSITLSPSNTIRLGNENGSITLAPDGTITLKGTSVIIDTPARSFVLETHRHTEVMTGGNISGEPLP